MWKSMSLIPRLWTKLAGGLENLMEDAKGLTKEEIQEELAKILEK